MPSLTSFVCCICILIIPLNISKIITAEARVKRQDDDGDEPNVDELCHDRPGDEYFRLSTDGDCRDVVR